MSYGCLHAGPTGCLAATATPPHLVQPAPMPVLPKPLSASLESVAVVCILRKNSNKQMVLHWCHCLVSSCSTTGRFLPAGPVAAEPAVQFSANFDRNGHKLLQKAEQLVQRVGGHALAVFADRKHNCHMYASSALQAYLTMCQQKKSFAMSGYINSTLACSCFPSSCEASSCQKQRCLIKIPTPGIKHGDNAGLHWKLTQTSWLSANRTKPSACTCKVARTCRP